MICRWGGVCYDAIGINWNAVQMHVVTPIGIGSTHPFTRFKFFRMTVVFGSVTFHSCVVLVLSCSPQNGCLHDTKSTTVEGFTGSSSTIFIGSTTSL